MKVPDLSGVPSFPRDDDGPVFREPWEAQAFGMAVVLHEGGHVSWPEWSQRLAAEIAAAAARGETDDGRRYYLYWLAALESLVADKRLVAAEELAERKRAWDEAARATPHGQPIELRRAGRGGASPESAPPP